MSEQIVGREAELAEIDEFVEAVPGGVVALSLQGEAGIGKTTLWREAVRRAEGRGYIVLACTPAAAEAKLSYGGLGDLLAAVPAAAFATLPAPQQRALDVVLLRVDAEGRPPEQRVVAVAVLSLLRALADASAAVLAVDDAQWLDRATASVLEFVARRLEAEPLGILASVRLTGEPAGTFDAAVAEARRRVVRVGPVSIGTLHEIVKERLGHSFLRPTLLKIERASGGNPFYALEIARELLKAGGPRANAAIPAPSDLRRLVSARVRRLPEEARDALIAASALSNATTALVDERALRPAEEADIVQVGEDGRIAFSHPLFASAVYESVSLKRRRDLHRRLAGLVDDIEDRARHLALAAVEPDEEVARALEQGAARARSRGAWESAAELLERARDLTPSDLPEEARRRGVRAAAHHLHEGDRPRAKALLEEILAGAPPAPVRGDVLRLLAEIDYSNGSFPEAARSFEEALAHTEDPRLTSMIELGLAFVRIMLWDFAAGTVHAQRALERATAAGDDATVAQALTAGVFVDYVSGRGVDWEKVEQALGLEDEGRDVPLQARPSSVEALLLLWVGRLSEARERLLALRKRTRERGDESDLAFFVAWLVWLETLSGNFEAAAAFAEEADLLVTLTGSGSTRAWVLAHRALLRAHRGEVDEARRDCADADALAERTGSAACIPFVVAARCLLELSLGDAAAAWEAATPLTEAIEAFGIGEPVVVLFLPAALEALVVLGDLDRVEALLDAFERRARKLDRIWALATGARCRGLLLAARGDLPGAEAALDRALVEHRRLEAPFERARTLLCLGRVQRRRKERKTARATLGEALAIFEQLGAPLWTEQTRAELGRIGVRRAPGELTAGEQAVAELAGQGLTNREIAAKLFLSRRTVEANLARVYRKLGIRSRAELGARMAVPEQ